MKVSAQHKNAHMSPRKLRLLRGVVRGLPATEAKMQLQFMPGKGAQIIKKVLNSAVANAVHNFDLKEDGLTVADVVVDGALTYKRYVPRSKGMANKIIKRTSNVTVTVDDGSDKDTSKGKKTDIETISVDDVVKQAVPVDEVESNEDEKKPATPISKPKSKSEEAYGKVKTMQQGGDKAKTHRRKSMSDS